MNWIKKKLVELLAPKFIKDKIAVLLAALGGWLVSQGYVGGSDAEALVTNLTPILTGIVVAAVGALLSIDSTKKGE